MPPTTPGRRSSSPVEARLAVSMCAAPPPGPGKQTSSIRSTWWIGSTPSSSRAAVPSAWPRRMGSWSGWRIGVWAGPWGRPCHCPSSRRAVLFDPGRFGREFRDRPTADFGRRACENLTAGTFPLGNVGAGAGTIAGGLKGGLGSASIDLGQGVIVGALVAVNPFGSVVNPNTGELFGAYLGIGDEFGPLPCPGAIPMAAPHGPPAHPQHHHRRGGHRFGTDQGPGH